ncbi:hypothetical protein GCM10022377_22380 [Zhihengliuella alba]|uniref:ABC transporter permease n=1 Tax=Zhihengliuella alba TaxID=547018 RepID=A0ABP7DPA3_9MICC
MSGRTVAMVGGLTLLFMLLGSALSVYNTKQEAITLEGNKLYSTASIRVTGNPREIVRKARTLGPETRIYVQLPGEARVRNLLVDDPTGLNLPLHEGRSFWAGEEKAAIVGAAIPVVDRDGREYFEYDGEIYEVIGRLGAGPDSLLAADVLLSDPARAFDGSGPIVVDRVDAYARYVENFGSQGVARMNEDTNRRTNVDFVSPLLLGLGTAIVTAGAVFTGMLAASLLQRRHHVLHLLGHRRLPVLVRSVGQLGLVAVMAGLPAFAAAVLAGDPMVSGASVLGVEALVASAVVVSFLTAAHLRRPVAPWS